MKPEEIRKDFSVLGEDPPPIYFDNACVALKPKQVVDKVNQYYKEFPACGGRSEHKLGARVTEEYGKARKSIAKFIGSKSKEVIFTRNTTEGINIIANSLGLSKGDIVLTTDKEHNSNLLPWQVLSKRRGIVHKIVCSRNDNTFDQKEFKRKVSDDDVKLVSMVHTSNLDGVTIPVKEIIKIAHKHGALVMLDAAQSVLHKKLDVKNLGVDFLVFSGHKMLGPSGTGVLYGKYELLKNMEPFLIGGDTVSNSTYESHELLDPPERFEAGLQNYAGVIGLGEAGRYLGKIKGVEEHLIRLNKMITDEFKDDEKINIIGPVDPYLRSGIFSFNVKGLNHHEVALMLNEKNIMVRSGQHCVHSWFNSHNIEGCVRVSLSIYNTEYEVREFIEKLREIIKLR